MRNQFDYVRRQQKLLNRGRAEGTRANWLSGPCLRGAPAMAPHPQSGAGGAAVREARLLDPWWVWANCAEAGPQIVGTGATLLSFVSLAGRTGAPRHLGTQMKRLPLSPETAGSEPEQPLRGEGEHVVLGPVVRVRCWLGVFLSSVLRWTQVNAQKDL